jgi:hypothetical protein
MTWSSPILEASLIDESKGVKLIKHEHSLGRKVTPGEVLFNLDITLLELVY